MKAAHQILNDFALDLMREGFEPQHIEVRDDSFHTRLFFELLPMILPGESGEIDNKADIRIATPLGYMTVGRSRVEEK